nr:brefeldin A-inhibited guanine nucleotide-exchange protein 1 [Nicotiana tomentosiformis]
MSASQTLGGPSRCGWVLGPSLDKIIKNVAWRKHSQLVAACKSALDKLDSVVDDPVDPASCTPLYGLSPSDADFVLQPLIMALDSASPKVVEPALDCAFRLFSLGLIRCEIDTPSPNPSPPSLIFRLIDSVCKCGALGDEAIELALLRVLLSVVRSPYVLVRGDCLVHVVRSCYNVYLGGMNGTNQICAKSVLAQMMMIVFTRVEENSMMVEFKTVSVAELLEFTDRNLNEGSSIQFAQNFLNEIVDAKSKEGLAESKLCLQLENDKGEKKKGEPTDGELSEEADLSGYSKIREDGFMLFKNLCKLSMKFSSQEHADDNILLRGKVLSLELLKVIMDNAGPIWRSNERFLNVIKQFLCLSLLKNSALSVMTIFQLLCSIFKNLLSKYRSGLKSEIGIFFPMLILRVLENVLQPSFLQKMTVLSLLEEVSKDPQIIIDVFVNYDCDVDAPNIFERYFFLVVLYFLKGVSLFNRKPSKGIDFLMSTKKLGNSAEDVASFLKNTTGLNPSIIGDYLGEREEFPLKVMHAYVDSFNFEGMDFGESIRYFLRGFRLPGEAQKIDRIMEKFAERYCKCNPNSFTSAETAYVLAYSVIMLNTDAHNSMVKDKMTKADFIRNNRGIDDGKDLPEDYLGALYDQIVKNEIKMNADSSVPQNKQGNSLNKLLGLDGILNLVWKQREEKPLGANGVLVRHIQEQFKTKSGKSESIYYVIADPAILRFMVEVCWGPMLAAFSVTLDQSDDKNATSQCLLGFRHAVHITAVMGMQTQRDAFVTSMAKFTYLHCAADMKQKNVDAMKTIMSIAIEDGNHLHEAWEHFLTCLSRFEHLQLLGEGAPSDSSFFTTSNSESEEKTLKSAGFPSLKKKGTLQNPTVAAVVRGGSYDSATVGANSPVLVTPEQINNFISNLNLLDQIGNFELNHIFAHSQRLNSEAIVAFVKALCKVSMSELQSPTDPRVFSLTKIVEVAHYNMNRIRLVWSHIWSVLSEFFVAVGLSENLSVAIFVMDSLRQLAMKFLEREELANYNFQNEFLKPFVIVMQKSNSAEIRELIVRCISQMVLSRVNNVKSGWKSVFMVFTAAAADERKNIVLLAFETMEKIVREYFRYITETETLTFTDCVRCLITFTNSRFNSDVSLNAIAFLRFCAVKLAEGGLVSNEKNNNNDSSIPVAEDEASDGMFFTDKDDYMSFWEPLLTGLSRLTSDPRSAIRKSALEVLFNILKDHGHLFPHLFWINVFKSVIYPIFSPVNDSTEAQVKYDQSSFKSRYIPLDGCLWDSETSVVAAQCLVDLFVNFFGMVRSELPSVVSIMVGFIKGSGKDPATTGVASLMRLAGDLGGKFREEDWKVIFLALKEASNSTLPNFPKLLRTMDGIEIPISQSDNDMEFSSGAGLINDESEDDNLHTARYVVSRMKDHIAAQLRIIQMSSDLYKMCRRSVSADTINILLGIYSSVTSHAQQLKSEKGVQVKLQKACSILEIPEPPLVYFENESYQNYLNFLHGLLVNNSSLVEKRNIETELVGVCEEILRVYLDCAGLNSVKRKPDDKATYLWNLPLGSAKKEELVARTPLVLSVLRILCSWQSDSFRRYISQLFPLMVDLVRSEHSSGEVQRELSHFFQSCIGPIIMKL